MTKRFQDHINREFPQLSESKLLVAISGGLDSVVLAHLCSAIGLKFSLAHCNFNLRGEESDSDEVFVYELAKKLNVEVFVEYFDTKKYAEDEKVSIQMAARELRYNWFLELKNALSFNYILTAHHANDSAETFLINFIRGTGLDGLTGIPKENKGIIRPLLHFSRVEIETFAKENNISWREDSSNASVKYLRNKIRHQIIPIIEEINPKFLESFLKTQHHLLQSADLLEDYTALLFREIVSKKDDAYFFDVKKIAATPNPNAVLYQLLNGFGFTAWEDIYDLLEAQSGKIIYSETHRLIKGREHLILTVISSEGKNPVFYISEEENQIVLPFGKINLEEVDEIEELDAHIVYLDKNKLQFPLKLRKWEAGDSFYPFGMSGTKKLSDFFTDKKLSLHEKENVWLLFSEDKIVWVINFRADNRYKIENDTQTILKVSCTS
ncbi:MAG TPA: tRNA lysidine(34) synthetase TilS [Salinimicrobium sp.]|nr:tRNA lysidine(34) synthetase TilS [Salinimicrobium sp.]